jgi:transcriptional repressor NrdR
LEKCFEKACWKIEPQERERMIDEIEMKLLNWKSVEIPSKEIAKIVMEKLKKIDPVAYIRFATVYLEVNSIEDFEKLLVDFKK